MNISVENFVVDIEASRVNKFFFFRTAMLKSRLFRGEWVLKVAAVVLLYPTKTALKSNLLKRDHFTAL